MRDIVIVGGGPAGLAVGIAAAQAGLDAVVLDGGRPPIDKACGEGLMPSAVRALEGLGVAREDIGGRPFVGIRHIEAGGGPGDGEFATGRFRGAPGLGLRRTELHGALEARARTLGVELRWGEAARGLTTGGVRTDRMEHRGRLVVGADGLHSRVRRWAGLPVRAGRRKRYGVRRHFAAAAWSDHVEIWWTDHAEAYVTPVGEREVGVAILLEGGGARFDERIAAFPALARKLRGAVDRTRERGAGPFRHDVPRVVRGGVALVGDAAGYVDPVTGEGLGLAFRQALSLVDALVGGRLASYQREHARLVAAHRRLTLLMLFMQRRPALRRRTIRALAAAPAFFSRILAAYNGELGWPRVAGRDIGRLATGFLARH